MVKSEDTVVLLSSLSVDSTNTTMLGVGWGGGLREESGELGEEEEDI